MKNPLHSLAVEARRRAQFVFEPDGPRVPLYHEGGGRLPHPLELRDPLYRVDGVEPEPRQNRGDRPAGLPHVLVADVGAPHRLLRSREVVVVHEPAGAGRPAEEDLEEVLVLVFGDEAAEVEHLPEAPRGEPGLKIAALLPGGSSEHCAPPIRKLPCAELRGPPRDVHDLSLDLGDLVVRQLHPRDHHVELRYLDPEHAAPATAPTAASSGWCTMARPSTHPGWRRSACQVDGRLSSKPPGNQHRKQAEDARDSTPAGSRSNHARGTLCQRQPEQDAQRGGRAIRRDQNGSNVKEYGCTSRQDKGFGDQGTGGNEPSGRKIEIRPTGPWINALVNPS